MQLAAYLMFNGTAKQALQLYSDALGGKVLEQHLYSESPEVCKSLPSDWHDKIMHASFGNEEIFFMLSDVLANNEGDCGAQKLEPETSPISLSLNLCIGISMLKLPLYKTM